MVSRAQLLGAGLSGQTIGRALRAGRLHSLFRGVYAVGHTAIGQTAWWQAALLACGGGAVLSHHTAAQLWSMRRGELFPISVIVPGNHGRKLHRINPRRTALHATEHMTLDGLAVTTPARTIVDMAAELAPRQLRELVERAQDLHRFNPREIRGAIERHPAPAGQSRPTRLHCLLEPDHDGARSHLERLFLPLARWAGLPRPEVNVQIEGATRDFVWRDRQLVVEVDGYAYHSSRRAMRRDAAATAGSSRQAGGRRDSRTRRWPSTRRPRRGN